MSANKCKIEVPNQLPEADLTRVQFKSWKEGMMVYLKQNEDFLLFLPGGNYETWTAAEENGTRIAILHASENEGTADDKKKKLAKRERDLNTMLSIIGRKVDQYDYDDVMNLSTSVSNVWYMIELVYDIGRKGVHFLDLVKLKYESGESPTKFYKKVYHHFMDNLYKKHETLKYKKSKMPDDEKLSPTLLNFMLYFTIQSIDSRLMKKIRDKWGHLLDKDTCLHDLKDTILKAIPDLLSRIDTKEFEANSISQLSAFSRGGRGGGRMASQRGRGAQGGNTRRPAGRFGRPFCRVCKDAKSPEHVYTSHSVAQCNRWTRRDVEDLRIMMCELKMEPNMYPDSSDTEQD